MPINRERTIKPRSFTVAEVSEYLGLPKSRIYRFIKEGQIAATKVKNRYVLTARTVYDLEKRIQLQRRIQIGLTVAAGIFTIAIFLLLFLNTR